LHKNFEIDYEILENITEIDCEFLMCPSLLDLPLIRAVLLSSINGNSKLTSAPVTSEFVGSIHGQTHSSCDREGDSL
jgi:hypothetical protein